MDPNETLRRIRSLVLQIEKDESGMAHGAEELAELVRALDHWMSRGGFAPYEWVPGRVACTNGLTNGSTEPTPDVVDYKGHTIRANDDEARYEVTTGSDNEVLFAAATIEECKAAIDEVAAEEQADEKCPLCGQRLEGRPCNCYRPGASQKL